MRLYWVGVGTNPIISVPKRRRKFRHRATQTPRRRHVTTEAQMCMTCLQAKTTEDHWQAAGSWKRQKGPSPRFLREGPAPPIPDVGLLDPRTGGTTSLLFWAPNLQSFVTVALEGWGSSRRHATEVAVCENWYVGSSGLAYPSPDSSFCSSPLWSPMSETSATNIAFHSRVQMAGSSKVSHGEKNSTGKKYFNLTPQRIENRYQIKFTDTYVHSCIIPSSQKVETTHTSISKWMQYSYAM